MAPLSPRPERAVSATGDQGRGDQKQGDHEQRDQGRIDRFRALYDATYDDLWRYCLRRTSTAASAEDVLSDTFAVAWEKLDQLPRTADFDLGQGRAWLFGIARNHVRNGWRKERSGARLDERLHLVGPTEGTGPGVEALATDDSESVFRALGRLKEPERELLLLAGWDELPHREIAAILDCSENAVAIRLHRARARFAKTLAKETAGPKLKSRKVTSPSDVWRSEEHPKAEGVDGA